MMRAARIIRLVAWRRRILAPGAVPVIQRGTDDYDGGNGCGCFGEIIAATVCTRRNGSDGHQGEGHRRRRDGSDEAPHGGSFHQGHVSFLLGWGQQGNRAGGDKQPSLNAPLPNNIAVLLWDNEGTSGA